MLFQRTPLVTALVLAGACSMATAAQADVVRVESGDLTGFVKTVPGTDARVDVFLGVPYAAAPVGQNRWASVKPAAAWRGIRQADTAPQPCKQKGQGSEDCLYANIYRPAGTAADANLPVAVYAHGGGNTGGNASEHDGARLATENGIIVMTIQYRLGAFGFLKLPGMDSSAGNFGITDTQAALAWVKRNAAAFGGNPDKVTLVTESAGSTNACRILVDPKSKGLVAGVVLQSEDCIHDVDSPKQAKERADKFLVLTGCAGEADPLACQRRGRRLESRFRNERRERNREGELDQGPGALGLQQGGRPLRRRRLCRLEVSRLQGLGRQTRGRAERRRCSEDLRSEEARRPIRA